MFKFVKKIFKSKRNENIEKPKIEYKHFDYETLNQEQKNKVIEKFLSLETQVNEDYGEDLIDTLFQKVSFDFRFELNKENNPEFIKNKLLMSKWKIKKETENTEQKLIFSNFLTYTQLGINDEKDMKLFRDIISKSFDFLDIKEKSMGIEFNIKFEKSINNISYEVIDGDDDYFKDNDKINIFMDRGLNKFLDITNMMILTNNTNKI